MKEHPDYKYRPRRKPKPSMANKTAAYSFPMPYSIGSMNPHHHAAAAGLDPLSWLSAAQHAAVQAVNSSASSSTTTTNSMSTSSAATSSSSAQMNATASLDLDKSRLFGFASPYGSHAQHHYYGMPGLTGMPGLAGLTGLPNLNGNNGGHRMSPENHSPVGGRMDTFGKGSPSPVAPSNAPNTGNSNGCIVSTSNGIPQHQQQQQQSPAALYSSLMYTKASAAAAASYHQAAAAAAAAGMQYPVAPGGYPSLDQLAGLRRPVPVLY